MKRLAKLVVAVVGMGVLTSVSRGSEPGLATSAVAAPGQVSLDESSLVPGTRVDLTGQWLFKPAYAVGQGEHPASDTGDEKYLSVPVPQLLNRIQWWLDDSEDFKKWEDARLNRLGFDTEKSDDGWYRMWIDVPALGKDRHLWVEFDGVAMRSEAYVNGQKLGEHAGMFSRFGYDLTPHLKPGKNLLAVHVGMEKIPDTDAKLGEAVTVNLSAAKVISMSKGMFGPLTPNKDNRAYDLYGIWQPVKLVVRGEAKIEDVFFVPQSGLKGYTLNMEASSHGYTGDVTVTARFVDPKQPDFHHEINTTGTITEKGIHVITGGQLKQGDAPTFRPWTPADPYLYRLEVSIQGKDGQVLDTWSHNVGFRTFKVQGNQLLLNGKPYFLRGANQLPYGKNPFSPELARKLIQYLHDNDVNSTRTHATPWNEAWLDAADEIGLAVSVEGIRPWAFAGKSDPPIMPPPAIFKHWLMENEDVVKRCRNHPAVFLFTVGNEMLLRDAKSLEKWDLLSQVVKQTRELAGGLPVVCSSDYTRDPEFYESTLKPKGLDDGDVDDMHRYYGWYADSPFVLDMKFDKELDKNRRERPLIGQEFATGYPDLDNGLPVWRYTRDLVTPLAWVGRWAYPPNSPDTFLTHHAIVTKRLAEKLRYQRRDVTSGFSLFSAECWFSHSFDPETVKPYPTLAAAKEFWSPVGLALETSQRRFYSGDTVKTNVFVTNDDEQFHDLKDLKVSVHVMGGDDVLSPPFELVPLASLPYYKTESVAVTVRLPSVQQRQSLKLVTSLTSADGKEISHTTDVIEVFPRVEVPSTATVVKGDVDISAGSDLRKQIEQGATVIVLSPGKKFVAAFPDDILDVKVNEGEFADPSPILGTPLGKDLRPMDIKWWARKNDWRCYVANQSHRLKPGGKARSLLDFTPAHSYISADKLPDQFRTVLFEIPLGQGRLWVCDLDLPASQGIDPVADLVMRNLQHAAADKDSTSRLPALPSHAEIVKTVGRPLQ